MNKFRTKYIKKTLNLSKESVREIEWVVCFFVLMERYSHFSLFTHNKKSSEISCL